MKELHFEYAMNLKFDTPVEKHRFTLKCVPISNERQEIRDLNIQVYPREFLSADNDSFGNYSIYGYAEEKHDHFSVDVTGTAITGLSPWETAEEEHKIGIYRYQTEYTRPGRAIKSFAQSFAFSPDMSDLQKVTFYMEKLYDTFRYVQGVTGLNTTAEEAMALGEGVCQDYSQILLSLCRMEKIPARYITGMLMGEGLSHGWVEIYSQGHWVGLDPTNRLVVDDQHIKISAGRDWRDCRINQGVFTGKTGQRQEIRVSVKEVTK